MELGVKSHSLPVGSQDYIELKESTFEGYIEIASQDDVNIVIGHKTKDVVNETGLVTKQWNAYKPFSAPVYIKAPNTTILTIITNRDVSTFPIHTISPRVWDDTQYYGQYKGELWM